MTRLFLLALAALAGCAGTPRVDVEAERAEIARLLQGARTAHFEKRADLLTAGFADTSLFVARGAVTPTTPEAARERMQAYFDRSTFQEWDDIEPPRIRVSPDGRMAYALVHKRVRLTAPDSTGAPVADHTVFAWVELYEKLDGRWRLMAVASTDRPGE
jgi:uncharacterized protein (TIGR02246 family)